MLNYFPRHTVYMIGRPAAPLHTPTILPPQPEHRPLPRQAERVERDYPNGNSMRQRGTPRPESTTELATHSGARSTRAIGMTLPNGSLGALGSESGHALLDARDVSGPGRPHSTPPLVNTTIEQGAHIGGSEVRQSYRRTSAIPAENTGASSTSSDRHEHAQLPSYNEATERISIVIDGDALQAIQDSSESFSVGFLEKIRAAQRDQYHFQGGTSNTYYHSPPQSFAPPARTIRRPLPPLPLTNSRRPEIVESGYVHHRSSIILPMDQSAPGQMTVRSATPDHIPARSANWNHSCSAPENSRHKCECTLEHHPQFRLSVLGSPSGHGDNSFPKHAYGPQPAATSETVHPDTVDLHLHLAPPQQPCNIVAPAFTVMRQVPPCNQIRVAAPSQGPQLNVEAESSLHFDELNVAERKPLSRMERALLRRIEFGPKVDYSILKLS